MTGREGERNLPLTGSPPQMPTDMGKAAAGSQELHPISQVRSEAKWVDYQPQAHRALSGALSEA